MPCAGRPAGPFTPTGSSSGGPDDGLFRKGCSGMVSSVAVPGIFAESVQPRLAEPLRSCR